MNDSSSRTLLVAVTLLATLAAGCEPYRIEYRRRPSYYQQLNDDPLPERVVLDDGTVLVYTSQIPGSTTLAPDGDMKKFEIREEHDDGSVTLRALMPEHVLANTLHCLRYEEYELLWNELVAEESKRLWATEGKGLDDFAGFMRKNRLELAQMLNRMRIGLATHETVVDKKPGGVLECRFWPQTALLFEYNKVVLVREDFGLKLLAIR